MRALRTGLVSTLAFACLLLAAAPAQAAKSCAEPGADWERATPGEAGLDAAKLQDAMDYGTSQLGFAVRVYRRGCLVGEDRAAAANRNVQFESWSMAKSVTALMFGRAMQLGLISPDDPVGSLVGEADREYGAVKMRDLLTMTSGLRWNGFRDYNIFTMPDRVRDALTLPIAKPRGTYFEYAQSAVSLLAEAIGRSSGQDAGAFVQKELMDPLGIRADSWRWTRDPAGHIGGFYGVNMRPDDFGRLGELMRRGGVWRGRRLLSREFTRQAVTPSETNGCYGWLIWVNAGAPCIGPTITERPVTPTRDFPDMPADMYRFSGLFGQLVTVFPSQDIVIVRTGQDGGLVFSGGTSWEHQLYSKVLGAVTDQRITPPGPAPKGSEERTNADYGFQTALREPAEYRQGAVQDPLPPAGPARARAALLHLAAPRAGKAGVVRVRLACPPQWPDGIDAACTGVARMQGMRHGLRYRAAAGATKVLRFRLTPRRLGKLRRARKLTLALTATNQDAAGGTYMRSALLVKRAAPPKR